jgi:hypothetical protein
VVLADREDTDAPPSIFTAHEPGYVTALAGKLDHSMWVADEVARILGCLPEARRTRSASWRIRICGGLAA